MMALGSQQTWGLQRNKYNLPAQKKALLDKYDSVFYFVIVLGSPFNLGPESWVFMGFLGDLYCQVTYGATY